LPAVPAKATANTQVAPRLSKPGANDHAILHLTSRRRAAKNNGLTAVRLTNAAVAAPMTPNPGVSEKFPNTLTSASTALGKTIERGCPDAMSAVEIA
jgi:hypothetical protein